MIADSWIDVEQFRLLVLHAAWYIDRVKDYKKSAEVHLGHQGEDAQGVVAKQVLRDYEGTKGLFPTDLISRREDAMERFRHLLEADVGNL